MLAIFGHEIHKHSKAFDLLAGCWLGWQASKPHNQRRLGNYWAWLVRKPQGPGALSRADRTALRVACVSGIVIYSSLVLSAFPPRHGFSDAPAIPEPTPPESYSQNGSVIHNAGVESTSTPALQRNTKEPEVRRAYRVDQPLFEESPGNWMPAETLSDINLGKAAEAGSHHRGEVAFSKT